MFNNEKIVDGFFILNVVVRLVGLDFILEFDFKVFLKIFLNLIVRIKLMDLGDFREEIEEM